MGCGVCRSPTHFEAPVGTRSERLKKDAYAQALAEVVAEEEAAKEEASHRVLASTTKLDYVAPPGTEFGTTQSMPVSSVPSAPATIWNPSGGGAHQRSAQFSDGMKGRSDIDSLIATRVL
jgi:hypothetical protein